MDKFVITGNKELAGEIEVRGSKNAAGACLAAALLTAEEVVIDNLPLIEDVKSTVAVLESMGVKTKWIGERRLQLKAEQVNPDAMDVSKFSKTRMSVILIGALVARCHNFKFPSPGGDKIGVRPITVHLDALRKLGVRIEKEGDFYAAERNGLMGKEIRLEEFSPTATEVAMLAAITAEGNTVINGAASELSVKDLGDMLVSMGAKIHGHGTHRIEIEGVPSLRGCEHSVAPDNLEAGTFIIAGALTPGRVTVKNINFEYLDFFLHKIAQIGVNFDRDKNSVTVFYSPFLNAARVQALPHPGFPTDLLPLIVPLLTRAHGKSLIHDPLYESRFSYLQELRKMGADIEVVDPHRAIIFGPRQMSGISIESGDVRAGAALVLAALMAEGKSVIHNVFQIDRGYEKIEERLQKLGADIRRISEATPLLTLQKSEIKNVQQ